MAEAMARAARTSASFPFAFEPSRARPVGRRARRDRARSVDALVTRDGQNVADGDACARGDTAPLTRFAIDGGVLDNSPVGAVLETMTSLSSETPVQRVVVFVVPYADDPATPPEPAPGRGARARHRAEHAARRRDRRPPRGGRARPRAPRGRPHLVRRAPRRCRPASWPTSPHSSTRRSGGCAPRPRVWTLVQRYRARLTDPAGGRRRLPGPPARRDALVARGEGRRRALAAAARMRAPADLWPSVRRRRRRVALRRRARDAGRAAHRRLAEGRARGARAGRRRALGRCATARPTVHRALRAYRTGEVARQREEAAAVADAPGTLTLAALARLSSATWTAERLRRRPHAAPTPPRRRS